MLAWMPRRIQSSFQRICAGVPRNSHLCRLPRQTGGPEPIRRVGACVLPRSQLRELETGFCACMVVEVTSQKFFWRIRAGVPDGLTRNPQIADEQPHPLGRVEWELTEKRPEASPRRIPADSADKCEVIAGEMKSKWTPEAAGNIRRMLPADFSEPPSGAECCNWHKDPLKQWPYAGAEDRYHRHIGRVGPTAA